MTDPEPLIPHSIPFLRYDPTPVDLDAHPLAGLQPGDTVYAVYRHGDTESIHPGEEVTVIPWVAGTPPVPTPPAWWHRMWARITRRPVEPTGEFTIQWHTGPPPDGRPAA